MGEVMRVGMLGCGHVGAAVARMLEDHSEDIARRSGRTIELTRVGIRDASAPRDVPVDAERFTTDLASLVGSSDVDVVVEVMGGVEPARSLILQAFDAGKPVVTANKELLATRSGELFEAARAAGVDLLYEASVGGGIPLIRPLRESLAGDRIDRFMGIVNGTTNYILTRMTEDGTSLPDALVEAQRLGFAEADPSADLEGFDAAAKAAILATIAFDLSVAADDVHREGISGLSSADLSNARRLGYVVKLLAIADADEEAVSVRVHPAMLPAEHPLASVRDSFNAVYVEGQKVGPVMLYGRGAGGDPTATSVVGDLIELARSGVGGGARSNAPPRHVPPSGPGTRRLRSIDELSTQVYVLLEVADRPGVLAAIAQTFAAHDVSIKQVWQEGLGEGAQLVLITHRTAERDVQACLQTLRTLDEVTAVRSVIRVEAGET
jgi:homoserine dehydrogenase